MTLRACDIEIVGEIVQIVPQTGWEVGIEGVAVFQALCVHWGHFNGLAEIERILNSTSGRRVDILVQEKGLNDGPGDLLAGLDEEVRVDVAHQRQTLGDGAGYHDCGVFVYEGPPVERRGGLLGVSLVNVRSIVIDSDHRHECSHLHPSAAQLLVHGSQSTAPVDHYVVLACDT